MALHEHPKPKYYAVAFPDSPDKEACIVHGWEAVLRLQETGRITFRGFHTRSGAEKHLEGHTASPHL